MEIKQKLRSEIEEKYKWDLSKIYKTDDDFLNEVSNFKKEMYSIKEYENNMMDSACNLYNCLELENKLDCTISKLYLYAHLHNDEDTTNTINQKNYGIILNLDSEYEKVTSFIIPTLMKYNYEDILKFYKDYPKLKDEYEILLKRIYEEKPYILDEKEEKLLSSLTKAMDNSNEIYSSLVDSDFTFDYITLSDGEKVQITDSNYSKYIASKDRNVRKQAFAAMYKTYKLHENSLSKCLSNTIDYHVCMARLRNYESCIFEALHSDNIDLSIYNNLINTVSNNLNPLFKYYRLKKKLLNLDELHIYDIYVPVVKDLEKEYEFKEAKQLVLEALKVLGKDYIDILNRAFDERWIDVYNNKGKRGGAYSSGSYGENPYLLLNYEGKLEDVFTLAHELGHSMHTYYSNTNNLYQYSGYSIFVAEVASTVNELLLAHYMLKNSNSKEEKINILNRLLELYKGTLFRQTMFAEFEKQIYELSENGEILTSDLLCDKYYKLNQKYFGDSVVLDDDIKYEWSRVPHFYYYFYVFKYATSICASTYIVEQILNKNEKFTEKYLKFLTLGSTMYPVDELKEIGIDMNKSEVIESAINYFVQILNEFEALNN